MSEAADKDSKTEEASESKIRDALEKGHVPMSREAATFGSLLGILLMGGLVGAGAARLRLTLQHLIDDPGGWTLENGADAVRLLEAIGWDAARLIAPAIVLLGAAGLAASLLQNPPRLVPDRVRPTLSRLSLSQGWKRLFGAQGTVEFLKALFKFMAVSAVAFLLLRAIRNDVLNAMVTEPGVLPQLLLDISLRLIGGIAAATLALAALDLVWTRVFWRRELRMTRQEVKEELKQQDGDPIVRARLRSLARDRSRKRMIAAVPRATVVIANPTHYAVALRYVREEGGAPRVLAKGRDLIALKIRSIAEDHGIPVIEDKMLARSLYDRVEVDSMIPPEFYKAVAQIIHFLMTRKRRAKS